MTVNITPHKPGDGGILRLPLVRNVPDADKRHPDWRQTTCPVCGAACWESDAARQAKTIEPEIGAACTECALRVGIGGPHEL